jgi:GNAT superfamily N-acetyltransferase
VTLDVLDRSRHPLLDQVLDETWTLWHDGLTRSAYGAYNDAQIKTSWGAAHLARVGLVQDGELLASAKRYSLTLSIDGERVPALGIGAVFTPPTRRGRGHAPALIERLCEDARREGCRAALLFSEIGSKYYERLGFSVIPHATSDIVVKAGEGAPAVLVRAGEEADSAHVAEMMTRRVDGYRFGLVHDADLVSFSVAKKRLLAGLDNSGRRSVEYFVTEEGHRAAAFVLIQVTRFAKPGEPERWSLAAAGDRDPTGARVGAMLQVLVARHPGEPPPIIRAWWPAGMTPPQLDIARRGLTAEVMMLRALDPSLRIEPWIEEGQACYWHGDAF